MRRRIEWCMATEDVTHILHELEHVYGLSQADIVRQACIPQPRLSKWMNGKAPRSSRDVLALAELLRRKQSASQSESLT